MKAKKLNNEALRPLAKIPKLPKVKKLIPMEVKKPKKK